MIAVLPAVGEELLFRGVIQKLFSKITRSHHWGIWISAILFSALHLQFYGFIPRLLLGAMFGYLLVWSGSLWLPILAHFINNAAAVTALFMIDHGYLNPSIEEFGAGVDDWHIGLFSLSAGLLILLTIKKQQRATSPKVEPPHPVYSEPHK
jgi:membrane protease YdiL (CAAX protease family)